jgi:hypothetical protein
MVEKYRTRLLEVSVIRHEPPHWEWQVSQGDDVLISGFENGQAEAKFEGYRAMFILLASGWHR